VCPVLPALQTAERKPVVLAPLLVPVTLRVQVLMLVCPVLHALQTAERK
jgi:hypothetical protein